MLIPQCIRFSTAQFVNGTGIFRTFMAKRRKKRSEEMKRRIKAKVSLQTNFFFDKSSVHWQIEFNLEENVWYFKLRNWVGCLEEWILKKHFLCAHLLYKYTDGVLWVFLSLCFFFTLTSLIMVVVFSRLCSFTSVNHSLNCLISLQKVKILTLRTDVNMRMPSTINQDQVECVQKIFTKQNCLTNVTNLFDRNSTHFNVYGGKGYVSGSFTFAYHRLYCPIRATTNRKK